MDTGAGDRGRALRQLVVRPIFVQPVASVHVTLLPFSDVKMYNVMTEPLTSTVPRPGTVAELIVTVAGAPEMAELAVEAADDAAEDAAEAADDAAYDAADRAELADLDQLEHALMARMATAASAPVINSRVRELVTSVGSSGLGVRRLPGSTEQETDGIVPVGSNSPPNAIAIR